MKFIADKFDIDRNIIFSQQKPFGFSRFDPGPGVGGHYSNRSSVFVLKSVRKDLIQNL